MREGSRQRVAAAFESQHLLGTDHAERLRISSEVTVIRNLATWERVLRIAAGLGLLYITFFGPQTYLGWIGLVPLINGLSGYCPIYEFFGFTSFHPERNHERATTFRG